MRFPLVSALPIFLIACAPAPPPSQTKAISDLTAESWYSTTVEKLAAISREADSHYGAGRFDEAAAAITKGQPLQMKLLEATSPTLAAMEAVSDLDDVYGRMLLHNGHTGYARSTFQKNVIRWKTWNPQTPETERRYKAAVAAVAECDRRM